MGLIDRVLPVRSMRLRGFDKVGEMRGVISTILFGRACSCARVHGSHERMRRMRHAHGDRVTREGIA